MKLELKFYVKNGVMPIDYRPYIMSYIKAALSKNCKQIFDEVYSKTDPKAKSFTFAVVFKNSKIINDEIHFDDKEFKLIFSSLNHSLILYLYNSLIKTRNTTKRFNDDFEIELKKMFLVPLENITADSVHIKFLSPLLVRQHSADNQDRYLTFEEEQFNSQLNIIIRRMLEDNNIVCKQSTEITLKPLKAKTTVIKNMKLAFCANIGEYILSGNPEILNILLRAGMGSRRGEGFGMFYVVKDSSA